MLKAPEFILLLGGPEIRGAHVQTPFRHRPAMATSDEVAGPEWPVGERLCQWARRERQPSRLVTPLPFLGAVASTAAVVPVRVAEPPRSGAGAVEIALPNGRPFRDVADSDLESRSGECWQRIFMASPTASPGQQY
jgi:hypothetical protein